MPKTYHLSLRSPKDDSQVWVLKGVPNDPPDEPPETDPRRIAYLRKILDPKKEHGLWLVDNGEGTAAGEVRAVHRALYDLHQVRDDFKDGDRIVMPRTKVRKWHSYETDAPTFTVPRTVFRAQSFHIVREEAPKRAKSPRVAKPRANPAKPRQPLIAGMTKSEARVAAAWPAWYRSDAPWSLRAFLRGEKYTLPTREEVLADVARPTQEERIADLRARLAAARKKKVNPQSEAAWATLEYLRPGEAIVEVTTTKGRWLGGGLVKIRSRDRQALYEEGYRHASQRARAHGLSLERFRWA